MRRLSHESSIMHAYVELTAVGATWPPQWQAFQKDHPQQAARLAIVWETESLINNSVMVCCNVLVEVGNQVRVLLIGLNSTTLRKELRSLSAWKPPEDVHERNPSD